MSARTSNAYLASFTLHGLFAAAIFLSAYAFRDEALNTKIIELVAGAGDNYGATVAPALGSPDSTKAEAAGGEASPINSPAPQPLEALAAPPVNEPKPVPKPIDLAKHIERIADRAEARNLKKFEKEQKAKAEAEAKAEAARAKEEAARAKEEAAKTKEETAKQNRMTKEEFDRRYGNKLNNSPRPAASGATKIAKIDAKGIAQGVVGGSTDNMIGGAGGKAMTREEGDMLDGYFSLLIQRLKEAHERPEGVSDLLSAQAEFSIAADGTISRVRIVRSSGSAEFDQSVQSAFRNVGSIGPRPDGGGLLTKRVTFKMRDE